MSMNGVDECKINTQIEENVFEYECFVFVLSLKEFVKLNVKKLAVHFKVVIKIVDSHSE